MGGLNPPLAVPVTKGQRRLQEDARLGFGLPRLRHAAGGSQFFSYLCIVRQKGTMITYRQIAEYLLFLTTEEGLTDIQSHIGTMVAHEGIKTVEEYFGGKIESGTTDIKDGQKFFYVYCSEVNEAYPEGIIRYFNLDGAFYMRDAAGQRIVIFPIAPEVIVTYKD